MSLLWWLLRIPVGLLKIFLNKCYPWYRIITWRAQFHLGDQLKIKQSLDITALPFKITFLEVEVVEVVVQEVDLGHHRGKELTLPIMDRNRHPTRNRFLSRLLLSSINILSIIKHLNSISTVKIRAMRVRIVEESMVRGSARLMVCVAT